MAGKPTSNLVNFCLNCVIHKKLDWTGMEDKGSIIPAITRYVNWNRFNLISDCKLHHGNDCAFPPVIGHVENHVRLRRHGDIAD